MLSFEQKVWRTRMEKMSASIIVHLFLFMSIVTMHILFRSLRIPDRGPYVIFWVFYALSLILACDFLWNNRHSELRLAF
ncbi:hypothetical protein MPTK1_7g15710 [Marchantia polymorpha subsp. ruderalis]|uniref:Uncharacterized protein n=2 Tax=Marchantia polymorpha TaxID=3197 RepID=A0AAF6C026_MARPO|nr:hypothetical protein MARPO_0111s0048 [Marchantia polymorpha]BBN17610.1 hypothetical protein Mp_7g15710 [Marchantia polymorpha subsp. ruderalis]|eukprot:PTQ31492.1 hypothetical protein MARPO_0111s0048 [Marchantia polymorpha]